jgi:hypothetical protein
MNLVCRLGIHSYAHEAPHNPLAQGQHDNHDNKVCRRCGKHFKGFLAPDQRLLWGETNGITVGDLRAALEGVPDDVPVEVGSDSLLGGGWAGAESAYLTTKRIARDLDRPETARVFRIAGWERGQGFSWTPGMGT